MNMKHKSFGLKVKSMIQNIVVIPVLKKVDIWVRTTSAESEMKLQQGVELGLEIKLQN